MGSSNQRMAFSIELESEGNEKKMQGWYRLIKGNVVYDRGKEAKNMAFKCEGLHSAVDWLIVVGVLR